MKGLTADWPLVETAKQSPKHVMELLAGFYNREPVIVYVGDAGMKGRFAYDEALTGFNYEAERRDLVEVLNAIESNFSKDEHPYFYMNSISVEETFPGLSEQNNLVFNHP